MRLSPWRGNGTMKPLLDLELLNTFATVVREGGFKGAAARLFRSQAAVSMQIKRLEAQVGERLLERNNRGIRLTATGERLLSYSEQLLRLNNEALGALRQEALQGSVHFGIPTDYARTFLDRFLPRLRDRFPGLQPRITCARSRTLRAAIQRGELDIAVVTGEPGFTGEKVLWSEAVAWWAPVAVPLEAQARLPVALFDADCILRDLCRQDLKQAGVDWRPALVSPDLANLAAAVDSGLAVALLPASSVLNPSRVRPLDVQVLPGDHMLSINLIHASTLTPGALAALAGCMADTLRSSNS